MEVVIRILGGGGSVEKREGNLAASASGARLRFVLVVDCVGLVARSVAVRVGLGVSVPGHSHLDLGALIFVFIVTEWIDHAISVFLLFLFVTDHRHRRPPEPALLRFFRLFNRSTSILSPSPSSTSLSTSSHTRFLSNVKGTFRLSRSSFNLGSLASSFSAQIVQFVTGHRWPFALDVKGLPALFVLSLEGE